MFNSYGLPEKCTNDQRILKSLLSYVQFAFLQIIIKWFSYYPASKMTQKKRGLLSGVEI